MSRLRAATDRCCCGRVCVCVCVRACVWRWRWLNGWKETVHQCEIWKQFDCIKAFKASPLISPLASRQHHTHTHTHTHTRRCAERHRRPFTIMHSLVCPASSFTHLFIHLFICYWLRVWSSCHLLYNRWTETFACPCKLLFARGACF